VRLPIGEIRSQPAGRELFRNLAAEVCAVAAAEGITLPADLPDTTLGFADALEPGGGSSLYHDLVQGRRMELDSLLGEVIRRGQQQGLDVPTSRAVYGVLQPWAARAASSGPS
jgi:2-dehydropantoate 2-reductase